MWSQPGIDQVVCLRPGVSYLYGVVIVCYRSVLSSWSLLILLKLDILQKHARQYRPFLN